MTRSTRSAWIRAFLGGAGIIALGMLWGPGLVPSLFPTAVSAAAMVALMSLWTDSEMRPVPLRPRLLLGGIAVAGAAIHFVIAGLPGPLGWYGPVGSAVMVLGVLVVSGLPYYGQPDDFMDRR